MNILVIGGSGIVGSNVLKLLANEHKCIGTYLTNDEIAIENCRFEKINVTNKNKTDKLIRSFVPSIVILACGTKHIGYCEAHPDEAYRVHLEGTQNVVESCSETGARVAYISTDCVFDGGKTIYTEQDTINPFNVYGAAKAEGEKAVYDRLDNYVIIRTSLVYGWIKPGQTSNFALSVLRSLKKGEKIEVPCNIFNTPIEAFSAAAAISKLVLSTFIGIINVAGQERLSRYDFAIKIANVFDQDSNLINAVYAQDGLRQLNSCLDVSMAEKILSMKFESINDGLDRMRYIEKDKKDNFYEDWACSKRFQQHALASGIG